MIRKIQNGKLQCYKCKRWKILTEFYRNKTTGTGYHSYCKKCTQIYSQKRRKKTAKYQEDYRNRPKVKLHTQQMTKIYYQTHKQEIQKQNRKTKLLKRYNLTPDDYNKLFKKQHGKCAICGKKKKLIVDHCHQTGHVRGLICQGCNIGLGHLGDTLQGLQNAIKYLTSN